MRISDFDYSLPAELIAQHPVVPRDASRLLVLHRTTGQIEHQLFRDLPRYLHKGDLLVLNDTRVLPARLLGKKVGTGGQAELLLFKTNGNDIWEAMARPGRRLHAGDSIAFGQEELLACILEETPDGDRIVQLLPGPQARERSVYELMHQLGELPLPPYITNGPAPANRDVYQTIFAREEGSCAAPTAGLHFTDEIFHELSAIGVLTTFVTLHVGLGTFKPVQVEQVEAHTMHEEYFTVSPESANLINTTKACGGRIIAVGTTATRTMESAVDIQGKVCAMNGSTRLFVTPGYHFRIVDVQLTNFHMPRSTLLLLIAAFAGREKVLHAYQEAINKHYRFLSFGDAMLML